MTDTIEIDNGQIIIAVRVDNKTYVVGTEDFKKFNILVKTAKRTLNDINNS